MYVYAYLLAAPCEDLKIHKDGTKATTVPADALANILMRPNTTTTTTSTTTTTTNNNNNNNTNNNTNHHKDNDDNSDI